MPLILPGNVATATAPTAYSVDNSCIFNGSEYTSRTFTAGNLQSWTFSCWIKQTSMPRYQTIFTARYAASNYEEIRFDDGDLHWQHQDSGALMELVTDRKFRDPSAWLHLCCVWDTAQGTPADRNQIWINGVRQTSFSIETNRAEDGESVISQGVLHEVGTFNGGTRTTETYMAEVVFIDGSSLAPTNFGEFDEDSPTIWIPKDPSGLTFGNRGFWLDFEDSSDFGKDVSGKGNDFTDTNFTAAFQAQDSPTNNFCVMNPLLRFPNGIAQTYNFGNLRTTQAASPDYVSAPMGTLAVSAGKWYWEGLQVSGHDRSYIGICHTAAPIPTDAYIGNGLGPNSLGVHTYSGDAQDYSTGVTDWYTGWSDGGANGDYISFAMDLDNKKIWVRHDGTWIDSGDPTSGATGTGALGETGGNGGFTINTTPSSTNSGFFTPAWTTWGTGASITDLNFGNGVFGSTALTGTTYSDGNNIGIFKYSVPSGFLALCTKNIGSAGG